MGTSEKPSRSQIPLFSEDELMSFESQKNFEVTRETYQILLKFQNRHLGLKSFTAQVTEARNHDGGDSNCVLPASSVPLAHTQVSEKIGKMTTKSRASKA